ncbi:MAG: enoyl-CoA hydratase/isomerase family protein [Alphaproteobacteria bacterium]|nr:MAG: enoyl-CoA hydratase/isomerase family protein [Alphaproteobacteria bacterium]
MIQTNHSDVRVSRKGGTCHIEMTRPKALNALSLDMIRVIDPPLAAAIADPAVRLVLITAEGERAFCAGGDVRAVALSLSQPGATMGRDFFFEEYRLNCRIHRCPKPYVALIDGISMGGGVGLSVHGSHRVVSEHVLFAMPETGIGLFPDVGGAWFLPRCPGAIGLYLALTGARLGAGDCGYIGYATHFVPRAAHADLAAALVAEAPADAAGVDAILSRFTAPFPDAPLAQRRATIDRCFSHATVPAILDALATDPDPWAQEVLATLATKSPLSMAITSEQLRRGAGQEIEPILQMEFRMSQHAMAAGDFAEGIRALLIDKDNSPRWTPATLAEVTPEMVARFFEPVDGGELVFE